MPRELPRPAAAEHSDGEWKGGTEHWWNEEAGPVEGFHHFTGTGEDGVCAADEPRRGCRAGTDSGTSATLSSDTPCERTRPPSSEEPAVTPPAALPVLIRWQRRLPPARARGVTATTALWGHYNPKWHSQRQVLYSNRPAVLPASTLRQRTSSPALARGASVYGKQRPWRRATALWGHYNSESKSTPRAFRRKKELL